MCEPHRVRWEIDAEVGMSGARSMSPNLQKTLGANITHMNVDILLLLVIGMPEIGDYGI